MARILSPRGGSGPRLEMWTNAVSREFTQINMSLASAYLSADITGIATATPTKATLDTELFDVGSNFGSNKYTFPVDGKYQVNFGVTFTCTGNHLLLGVAYLYLDGAVYQQGDYQYGTVWSSVRSTGTYLIDANAAQYIELWGYGVTDSGTLNIAGVQTYHTFMTVHLISLEK